MIDQNTDTAKASTGYTGKYAKLLEEHLKTMLLEERLKATPAPNETATERKKRKLLEHYATREPKDFVQVDVFASLPPEHQDYVMEGDEDGDVIFIRATTELMLGSSIRVLADPAMTKDDAIRALRKVIDVYENDAIRELPKVTEASENTHEDVDGIERLFD